MAKPARRPKSSPPLAIDTYHRWHLTTGYIYLPADRDTLPLLVRLTPNASRQEFLDLLARKLVRVSAAENTKPKESRYVTFFDTYDQLKKLRQDPAWKDLVFDYSIAGQPLHPALNSIQLSAWPQQKPLPQPAPAPQPLPSQRNAEVVVAVIDDGIAFAHDCFRDENGKTRIQAFWNQDSQFWLDAAYINDCLANRRFGALVDEDGIYASEGLDEFSTDAHKRVARRRSHGTHVLNLATALPHASTSSSRPILAVQFPATVAADTSGNQLAPYLDVALAFIEARMAKIGDSNGKQPPLVVNLSYGMAGGPHDGTHLIEERIDEFIRLREDAGHRTEVVIAAGNMRLTRGRVSIPLGADVQKICWRIQPDDRTSSALEAWVPPGHQICVRVKSPTGSTFTPWVGEGGEYPSPYASAPCMIDYTTKATTSGRRAVTFHVLPTSPLEPLSADETAPAGVWTLEIKAIGDVPFVVDAYVQRDDTPLGYRRRGRQSYIEDSNYDRFDRLTGAPIELDRAQKTKSMMARAGTLNAISTGPRTLAVGGCRRQDGCSARYSSLGAAANRPCPTVAAVSDDSLVRHGVLAAGARSGSTTAMNGTSVAAPQLTRWIADVFAALGPVDAATLRALVAVDAKPTPCVPMPDRKQAAGLGLVEVASTTTLKSGGAISR